MTASTLPIPTPTTDTASSDAPMTAQEALRIITDASLLHPLLGWSDVNALTDFQGRIIKRPGGTYNNFVEALASLGLSRDDAVDAFTGVREQARRDKKQQREEVKRGPRPTPTDAIGIPAAPAAAPAPVPERPAGRAGDAGSVVRPRPPGQPSGTETSGLRQPRNLAQDEQRPAHDSQPARRAVRGKAKTDAPAKPAAVNPTPADAKQTSLF